MKRVFKLILIILFVICIGAVIYLFGIYKPTFKADFSVETGEVMHGASGFLYGLAEPDIPSVEIVKSISPDTFAQKTYGGLQHPIGDINHVYGTFHNAGGNYLLVYCQDMYSTWYYQLDSLPEFYEKVRKTVTDIENAKYENEVVYCVYNECDNGVWFGDFNEEENRFAFYEAFKEAFNIVKQINPEARIAGPGYCGYDESRIREFLSYCKYNSCLPEVIVWHELGDRSVYLWEEHFDSYYGILDELKIDRDSVEVNISEYGLMRTNGIPGESVKWISRIEDSKVHACVAYWRLANNLCDAVADDVMPNGNYWLYRFYSCLMGNTVKTNISDLFQSNFENAVKKKEGYHIDGLSGVAALDSENRLASAIVGGTSDEFEVEFSSLKTTNAFKDVDKVLVTVYRTEFKGLVGEVPSPEKYLERTFSLFSSPLKIKIGKGTDTRAFFVTVKPFDGEEEIKYKNDLFFERYEAEDALTEGQAKSYEHAFAFSGSGFLGFIDTDEDAAVFNIDVPKSGEYRLDIVYSNGSVDENGKRVSSTQKFFIDSVEQDEIVYPSSIKYEHSACVSRKVFLEKGKHVLKLAHSSYSAGLDFIDVTEINSESETDIFTQRDYNISDKDSVSYLVSTPSDGFYEVEFGFSSPVKNKNIKVNSVLIGSVTAEKSKKATLFLRRGVSYIEVDSGELETVNIKPSSGRQSDFSVEDFKLNGASVENGYISDISSENGNSASVSVNCDKAGVYAMTVYYSNDGEGGLHDYNVDLIEKYCVITVNGKSNGRVYFRNTYSLDTVKTKTVYISLNKGLNEIVFSNDGKMNFNGITTFAPEIKGVKISDSFNEVAND